jgi:hypothetical protein
MGLEGTVERLGIERGEPASVVPGVGGRSIAATQLNFDQQQLAEQSGPVLLKCRRDVILDAGPLANPPGGSEVVTNADDLPEVLELQGGARRITRFSPVG